MLNSLPTLMTPSAPAPQSAGSAGRSEAAKEAQEERPAFARQLQQAQGGEAAARASAKAAAESHKPAGTKSHPKLSKVVREPVEADEALKARKTQRDAAGLQQPAEEATGITQDLQPETADASGAAEHLTGPEGNPQVLGALLAQLRGQSPASAAPGDGDAGSRAVADVLSSGGAPYAAGLRQLAGGDRSSHVLPGKDQTLTATGLADGRKEGRQEGINAQFMDQQAEQQSSDSPAESDVGRLADAPTATLTGPAAPATSFAAQLARNTPTPAQAQAQLPAALGSPDFAPQLGTQITTFVRDGVQHAQLHLNPADMGPVSVQIQLDGQGARVHLMADQAQTRQALEQALPQLAGSLREAGLTLTGGGVFQQPRQSGGEGREDGSAKGGRSRTGIQALRATEGSLTDDNTRLGGPAASRRRGVVDLIA